MTKHWAMNQAFALTVGTASAQGLMTVIKTVMIIIAPITYPGHYNHL